MNRSCGRSPWLLTVLALLVVCLLLLALAVASLPAVVRALPGRYAYYLPPALQEWRRVEHPETLPTPAVAAATASPTELPSEQATAPPMATVTEPLPLTPSATAPAPLPSRHVLTGFRHEPQGWNNCGPATLAMALSYWGRTETQREIAPVLKPDPEDKNVSPEEMAEYVRTLGLEAVVRVGGDLNQIRRLLAGGFPVVVETWYVRAPDDQMGHYRLIIGYDDEARQFLTYDSLHGPDLPIGYQELDELWRVFNRVYLVIYPPERQADVATLLGPSLDEANAVQQALETARLETLQPAESCVAYADCANGEAFSWFNVGSSLAALARYEEAAAAYDQARVLGLPWRMLWYQFGPYEAYYGTGRYEDVVALADVTLAVVSNLEESYYWRGLARQAQGDSAGARSDFESALRYHQGWPPALEALGRLPE